MKKILSLIVVLMLAFNVKAQTAPDFNCIDEFGRNIHLYNILDNGQYAFLYFFFTETDDPEGQFSQIVSETYYYYGANQDEVYFIGIDPTGDSLSADWWRVDYQVDFPIIHNYTAGTNVHDICEIYYGVKLFATLKLVAPDHQIIIDDIWPVNSTQHLISTIDAAIAEHKKTAGVAEFEKGFAIYPNPANDRLYIATETEVEEVVIYDIFGRHQVTETPSHQGGVVVDVTNLNSGIYFVKVVTEKGETVQRFVKK